MIAGLAKRTLAVVSLCMAATATLSAQNDMRGHWSGSVETASGPLNMEVDLDQTLSGWIGSVSIPVQRATGIPLEAITFRAGKGTFRIKVGTGVAPAFSVTLSPDGQTLTGAFSQGADALPLNLTRAGEPNVSKASPAVTTEFLGTWQGSIDMGASLRVTLTILNTATGSEALLVSVDQAGAQIPINAIVQRGKQLKLTVRSVGGGYEGELSADGTQLTGTWTQQGNSVPLIFKKAVKP